MPRKAPVRRTAVAVVEKPPELPAVRTDINEYAAERVLDLVAEHGDLEIACRKAGLVASSTNFAMWARTRPKWDNALVEARRMHAERLNRKALDIASEPFDWDSVDQMDPAAAKLRVDAHFKALEIRMKAHRDLAERMAPAKGQPAPVSVNVDARMSGAGFAKGYADRLDVVEGQFQTLHEAADMEEKKR